MIRDSVVHEADSARFLLGEEITAVSVVKGRPTGDAPTGVSDPMLVLFEAESGALVTVEIFVRTGLAYEVRTEVVAERGSATIGLDQQVLTKRPASTPDALRDRGAGRSRPTSSPGSGRPTTIRCSAGPTRPAVGSRAAATPSTGRAAGTAMRLPRSARPASPPSSRTSASRPGWRLAHEAGPRRADVPPHPRGDRPARRRRPRRLLVDGALPEGGLHPVLLPPARRLGHGGHAATPGRRRRRGDLLGAARPALVRPVGGCPAGRGPGVATRHPDHGRPRRGHRQHRVQRPARGRRARRGDVPALVRRARAGLRARGHPPGARAAPRRLHRGRPRGGRHGGGPGPRLGRPSSTARRTRSTRATTRPGSSRAPAPG